MKRRCVQASEYCFRAFCFPHNAISLTSTVQMRSSLFPYRVVIIKCECVSLLTESCSQMKSRSRNIYLNSAFPLCSLIPFVLYLVSPTLSTTRPYITPPLRHLYHTHTHTHIHLLCSYFKPSPSLCPHTMVNLRFLRRCSDFSVRGTREGEWIH